MSESLTSTTVAATPQDVWNEALTKAFPKRPRSQNRQVEAAEGATRRSIRFGM